MTDFRRACGLLAAPLLLLSCSRDAPPEDAAAGGDFCASALPRVEAFTARAAAERPVPDDPRYGGTVAMAVGGDIRSGMNAFAGSTYEAFQHHLHVNLMSLIRLDEALEPVPYLAESWTISEDTSRITFRLRDDVFWHDGERTDARDVAFTYERVTDPATAYPNAAYFAYYVPGAEGVEVIDSFTVAVRIERPHAELLDTWRALAIMPEHLLGDVPPAELAEHPFGTVCPVGNGPFVFSEHRPGESWTFRANPAFPEGLGGRPFLDRYVLRVISEPTTRLAELLTEGIDVEFQAQVEQVPEIEAAPHLEVRSFLSRDYGFLGWNARVDRLADVRVRRALTLALDRQGIVEAILGPYGRVAQTTVQPSHWAYDPELEDVLVHDPDEARRLLAAAGWTDRDGDGVREDARGEPLSIGLKYNAGNAQRAQIAEIVQAQLREVGVDVELEVVEIGTLVAQIMDVETRPFEGVLMAWSNEFRIDDRDLFHSDRIDGQFAFAGTRNPEIDRLLDTLQLVVDRDEARPLWRRYQELLVEEQPYTFLFFRHRILGMNRRIRNATVDLRGEWSNLKDWWIDPEER